ncbi:MAG: DUF72 domain-containing protein [Luteitalea sp.]|nr:DUF72 domain-containing protein [Luteitalea sp.]
MTTTDVRIGTSGWQYPRGRGAWNGLFYPTRTRRSSGPRTGGAQRLDDLAYYAERFDTVEINTSFYRPVSPDVARRWVERTPAGFEFSVKLYQKFTHPEMYMKSVGRPDATIVQADLDDCFRGLEPFAATGKLGALLAQFPPRFKATDESREYLAWLLETFRAFSLAVELRHRSWSDDAQRTLDLLNETGAAWVQIDEPKFRFSIRQDLLPNTRGFYYMRLHGRNAAQWWRHDRAEDRYDYLYSAEELDPFVDVARAIGALVKKMYLYTNNHFAAKAAVNAIMLRDRMGLPNPGDYPAAFVEQYPEVRGLVAVQGSGETRKLF